MSKQRRLSFDLHAVGHLPDAPPPQVELCPLCERPIPPGARSSRHHLIPKLKGGAKLSTVRLHQICHSAIHARFSEAQLARHLNDIHDLRREPALADFLAWVRTKPADFHARTSASRGRRADRTAQRSR